MRSLAVADQRIVVPVAFERFSHQKEPDACYPFLEDRMLAPLGAPSVVANLGAEIMVQCARMLLDKEEPLFLSVSDPDALEVRSDPPCSEGGLLPPQSRHKIWIRGKTAGPEVGATGDIGSPPRVDILWGSSDREKGVRVASLHVVVLGPLVVPVQPFLVSLRKGRRAPIAPATNPETVARQVSAILSQAALDLQWKTPIAIEHPVARGEGLCLTTDGDNAYHSDVCRLFSGSHKNARALNLYLVPRLLLSPDKPLSIYGFGASDEWAAQYPALGHSGVIGADADGPSLGAYLLAHEIGHFFGLEHPENSLATKPRDDSWSRMRLMYPKDDARPLLGSHVQAFKGRDGEDPNHVLPFDRLSELQEFRFGLQAGGEKVRPGHMLTHRRVPGLTTDGEVGTMRERVIRWKLAHAI